MSMYDKNHYNTVISLQLIKINGIKTNENKTKQKSKVHFKNVLKRTIISQNMTYIELTKANSWG